MMTDHALHQTQLKRAIDRGLLRCDEAITPERVQRYPWILLAAYGVVLASWSALSERGVDANGIPLGADFVQFYAAATLGLNGHALEAFSPAAVQAVAEGLFPKLQGLYLWFYPPSFLLLLTPLGGLPYQGALLVFTATGLALYLLLARFLTGRHPRSWLHALAFPAAFANVLHGQAGFLSVAFIGFGLALLPTTPILAGVLLGLASIKPHLGLLLPVLLIAGGFWRAFLSAAATVLALVAITSIVFGHEVWIAFMANLPLIGEMARMSPDIWHKMPSVFITLRMLGCPEAPAFLVHTLTAVGIGAATALAWHHPGSHDVKVALAGVASLFVSPYVMNYDLILLGIPIAIVARHGFGSVPGRSTVLVLAAMSPLVIGIGAFLHVQPVPLVMVVLYAVVWSCRHETARPPKCRVSMSASDGLSRKTLPEALSWPKASGMLLRSGRLKLCEVGHGTTRVFFDALRWFPLCASAPTIGMPADGPGPTGGRPAFGTERSATGSGLAAAIIRGEGGEAV